VIDPDTSAGAYKISDGGHGGWFSNLMTSLAGLSGFFDGQTRFKYNWFNSGNAALYAKISGILTVVAALLTVGQILNDSKLSISEKITQILINIGAAIITLGISQVIMSNVFLAAANPIILGVLIATVAISVALLASEILSYARVEYRNKQVYG
jgi:hypothetical protein